MDLNNVNVTTPNFWAFLEVSLHPRLELLTCPRSCVPLFVRDTIMLLKITSFCQMIIIGGCGHGTDPTTYTVYN